MKRLIPIMIILLMVSTSIVGVSYDVEKLTSSLIENPLKKSGITSNHSVSKCYSIQWSFEYQKYIWFTPDNPETFYYIKNISFPSSTGVYGSTFVTDEWWISDSNGALAKLDIETGDADYIGHTGIGNLVGIAYHEISDVLYGISPSSLYIINMTTAKATLIGNMGNSGIMISLDCDKNGTMYAYELNLTNGKFYSIDLATGNATFIGYTGVALNYGQDMAYDYNDENMYSCIFNYDTFQGEFHKVNLETGSFSYIGTLKDGIQLTNLAISYYLKNRLPTTPEIEGKKIFKVGESGEYIYNFSSIDPDNDSLLYSIDWFNGTVEEIGPYESGEKIFLNVTIHAEKKGAYNIFRVKAIDENDAESDWATLEITVPKSQTWFLNCLDKFPLLQRLLEVLIR